MKAYPDEQTYGAMNIHVNGTLLMVNAHIVLQRYRAY